MPTKESVRPLAAMEVSASGGPFRQYQVRLESGQLIYVTFQAIYTEGLDISPAIPTPAHINETIGILSSARALG